jgi:hypothetical protein
MDMRRSEDLGELDGIGWAMAREITNARCYSAPAGGRRRRALADHGRSGENLRARREAAWGLRLAEGRDVPPEPPASGPFFPIRGTPSLFASPPVRLADVVEQAVRRIEGEIANEVVEHLVAIDPRGEIVLQLTGSSDFVSIPPGLEGRLRDAVLTHNHPAGYPFSLDDIVTAVQGNVVQLRAVSQNWLNELHRPEGGWPGRFYEDWQLAQEEVLPGLWERVGIGKMTEDQAAEIWVHETLKRLRQRTGIYYARTPVRRY